MRRPLSLLLWLACLAGPCTLEAQDSTSLVVSGSPAALVVAAAPAGREPTPALDDRTTYALSSATAGLRITANLDAEMPSGMLLTVHLAAPVGATSAGRVVLSTLPRAVVTGLPIGTASGLGITYELSATLAAGSASGGRTVTFTLTAGP